jgi:hypothetical protein
MAGERPVLDRRGAILALALFGPLLAFPIVWIVWTWEAAVIMVCSCLLLLLIVVVLRTLMAKDRGL